MANDVCTGAGYNSQEDDGDDLFADYEEMEATIPLSHPYKPAQPTQASPYFASPAPATTQPTQILDTPVRDRTDANAVVQVPASSPSLQARGPVASPSPTGLRKTISNATSGTTSRPSRLPVTHAGSFSDDSPAAESSDDELSKPISRSEIKPSNFLTKNKPRIPPPSDGPPSVLSQVLDQFKYQGPASRPQKRSADDMANAYSSSPKRPRTQPRQTGPSRALPVDEGSSSFEGMKLEDIPDWVQKQRVKRMLLVFGDKPVSLLYEALVRKKGQYDDALNYVCELEEEQERKKAPKVETIDLTKDDASPVKPSKFTTNKSVQSGKTIASKWSSISAPKSKEKQTPLLDIADDSSATESPAVKPRGRLRRGRPSVARSPTPEEKPTPQKPDLDRQRKKVLTIESDSDASDKEEEVDEQALQESLLTYINKCSAEDLADLSEKSLEDCQGVLERRPFKNLDQIRKVELNPPKLTKTGKVPRTHMSTGTKVLNDAEKMWTAYQSINELVSQCQEIGEPIKAAMKYLGGKSLASDASGELNLGSLDEVKNDSGVGTPSSASQTDDDDDVIITKSRFSKLQKPSIMAEDLVLKDYQLVGLNWLNILWTNKLSGILADDMGLGKTCQVISFLAHLKESGQKGIHLIVVPNTTLENWFREFSKFIQEGTMHVEPYYGSQAERMSMRADIESKKEDIDVIITTYSTMSSTDKNDAKFLRRLEPTVCVFDEGHQLRNSSSQKYQCAMRIPATMRLLLTGTPLQNNLQEMASLLGFIMPEVFAEHAENLKFIFRRKATTTEENSHASLLSVQRTARARSMMTPFILRRRKEQVLGKILPAKTCRVEYCELDPKQKRVYSDVLALQQKAFQRKKLNLPSPASSNYLMKLRLTACHPLLDRHFFNDEKITRMAEDHFNVGASTSVKSSFDWLRKLNDFKIMRAIDDDPQLWGKYQMEDDLTHASGKFQKTVELVKEFAKNGDRALFFSQFKMVLDVMEEVLSAENIPFLRFDGSTNTSGRQDIIDQFYQDATIPIFLVSTGSGGTGINITAANKVIIHDLSWNPQEDIQAENRAHRVGQLRDVEVIRLVTRGTIEEQILALGNSKLELDKKVAGAGAFGDDSKTSKVMQDIVAQMLFEQMEAKGELDRPMEDGQDSAGNEDVAEQFKSGLKKAGVKMA